MSQIADLLLASGAFGAAFYCFILSRRLKRFTDLENGVGGAVALLSAQVDDLGRALSRAQEAAQSTRTRLSDQVRKADATAQRLELLVASVHDISAAPRPAPKPPEPSPEPAHFMRHPVNEEFPR